ESGAVARPGAVDEGVNRRTRGGACIPHCRNSEPSVRQEVAVNLAVVAEKGSRVVRVFRG
ncbi:MAG TPA: hypothetical protein VI136_02060, partial [Verrucomicrobiae bacterium]